MPLTRRDALSAAAALALTTPAMLAAAVSPQAPAATAANEPLAVMSFNIRYGTAKDGDNHWEKRRAQLFDLLRSENADLIGLQEALRFQVDEILAAVPGYGVVGVGRDDGRAAGEMSAILYRTARFHVAATGTFWYSDTPEVPGSKSWGNRITRIATWARFIDRNGAAFWLANTHLDHESQPSREKSTALLLQRIQARPGPGEPVIVTGDFNAGEDNAALHVLTGQPGHPATASAAPFVDTFRVAHPDEKDSGTFSNFVYGQHGTAKIDYVLVAPGTTVLSAGILRNSRDNRYPSDHFPVVAKVQLTP
jgi:endonuclease/exonuclease/phosphatase family metal-dependent hydrolase